MLRVRRTRKVEEPEPTRIRRTRTAKASPATETRTPFKYNWRLGQQFQYGGCEYEVVGFGPEMVQVKCIKIAGRKCNAEPRSWYSDEVVASALGL